MAYTEVFYPKLPMEGCADRIQDVIVRSGFSNGQVSERYRLETPGGAGLGWAIVRDTVEKRGGTVEAANRPGGGAVFTVRWPWREGGGQT